MTTTSPWRKSSRSTSGGGNCVETRTQSGLYQVRDSKLGDDSPIFTVSGDEFQSFLNLASRK